MFYRSLLSRGVHLRRLHGAMALSMLPSHPMTFGNVSHISLMNAEKLVPSSSCVGLAGSPLFVTDLSKPFDFSEIQFVLSEQVCSSPLLNNSVCSRLIQYSKYSVKQKPVHGSSTLLCFSRY